MAIDHSLTYRYNKIFNLPHILRLFKIRYFFKNYYNKNS